MKFQNRWPISISILLALYLTLLLVTSAPHSFVNNIFLVNYTFIGDGIFIAALIALLFYKKQILKAQSLLLAVTITTVVIQLIKNVIFDDGLHIFLEEGEYLFAQNQIVDLGGMPSSHMAYGMAFFTLISFYFSSTKWTIALVVIAIVLAYSRIYLSGNTVLDVIAGGVTGLLASLLSYSIFFPVRKSGTSSARWGKTATLPH